MLSWKRIGLIICLIAAFLITGCGNKKEAAPVQNLPDGAGDVEVKIVTSFYPVYVMTINIAKNVPGVSVVNMTKPVAGCLHDYQMTPDDVKCLSDADILVINGAGMESFMDKVSSQQPGLKIIEAAKGIELLQNESDGEPNPHVWVSVTCAIDEVNNIGKELAALDPKHAQNYLDNTAAYVKKLEDLRMRMHAVIDSVKQKEIVTFHEAFPYFAKEFGLHIAGVIEREPGAEPSAGELAQTIQIIKDAGVTALFAEPQYSAKAADTIAQETGAKVYALDPAVTGPMDPEGYLKIMEENLKILGEALN